MKAMTPLVGAALVLAVATACAQVPDRRPPTGKDDRIQTQRLRTNSSTVCLKQQCEVDVRVFDGCRVEVGDYYTIMVAKAPVTLTFKLHGNGDFEADGVFFKTPEGQRVFKQTKVSRNLVEFSNDKTTGVYPYGVRVRQGKQVCPVLDPTGVNDMGSDGLTGP